MKINIGNRCTECGQDTSWEIDTIPNDAEAQLVLGSSKVQVNVEGYLCVNCQVIPASEVATVTCVSCDGCGELTLEYTILDKECPEMNAQSASWRGRTPVTVTLLCENCLETEQEKDEHKDGTAQ
jgi:hypothetical protein